MRFVPLFSVQVSQETINILASLLLATKTRSTSVVRLLIHKSWRKYFYQITLFTQQTFQ